jgi:hypothetical protein
LRLTRSEICGVLKRMKPIGHHIGPPVVTVLDNQISGLNTNLTDVFRIAFIPMPFPHVIDAFHALRHHSHKSNPTSHCGKNHAGARRITLQLHPQRSPHKARDAPTFCLMDCFWTENVCVRHAKCVGLKQGLWSQLSITVPCCLF